MLHCFMTIVAEFFFPILVSLCLGACPCQVTVDAYFAIRNASEYGTQNILRVMNKYRDDIKIQGAGLQCMSSSLLEGNC